MPSLDLLLPAYILSCMTDDVQNEMCELFRSGTHSIPDLMKKYGFGRNKVTRLLKEWLGDDYQVCAKRIAAERGKIGSAKRKGCKNPHTPEWNKKISESQKGRIVSEETKKKISESMKTCLERGTLTKEKIEAARRKAVVTATKNGFYEKHGKNHSEWLLSNSPNRGRHFSEETRKKMSKTRKEYYDTGGESPMKGKTHSSNTKVKISETTSQMWKDGKFGYGNNGLWRSKLEISVFEEFLKLYPDTIHSHPITHERTYVYDVYIPGLKLVVEVNGDYWHLNPELYKECYFDKSRNILASDLWKEDKKKLETADLLGYRSAVIWENDVKLLGVELSVRKILDSLKTDLL